MACISTSSDSLSDQRANKPVQRTVTLDTETTGISHRMGDRVIEIGAVELIDDRITGRKFHTFLQPGRPVHWAAQRVHGISDAMLRGKPVFADRALGLLAFLDGAEVVAHNASFDIGFLDNELRLSGIQTELSQHCRITCSLRLARVRCRRDWRPPLVVPLWAGGCA